MSKENEWRPFFSVLLGLCSCRVLVFMELAYLNLDSLSNIIMLFVWYCIMEMPVCNLWRDWHGCNIDNERRQPERHTDFRTYVLGEGTVCILWITVPFVFGGGKFFCSPCLVGDQWERTANIQCTAEICRTNIGIINGMYLQRKAKGLDRNCGVQE